MNVDAVEHLLRTNGCSLTPQRRAILRFLDGNLDHPSAQQIFDAVTADFPITSRATVYNTLTLLEQLGAVRTLPGATGETRYDPNVTPHHHLLCDRCGRLEDVASGDVSVLLRGALAQAQVRFNGRCTACDG
jgi:Fur family peroxide stress response transcriptional regulator